MLIIALLNLANEQDLTQPPILAKVLLAGFMTAISAVGITELHKMARPSQENGLWHSQPATSPSVGMDMNVSTPAPMLAALPVTALASTPSMSGGDWRRR